METINARVMNRFGTEAEWLADDPILLKGEIAFVNFSGIVYTKVGIDDAHKFSQINYNVLNPTGFKGLATPTTNPGTPSAPEYWVPNGPGTFTNFKNSSNAAIVVPATVGSNTVIDPKLVFNGSYWTLTYETISISGVAASPSIGPTTNLFDVNSVVLHNFVDASGNVTSGSTTDISISNPINVFGLDNITLSGMVVKPAGNNWVFKNAAGVTLTNGTFTGSSTQTLAVPVGAKLFYFNAQVSMNGDVAFMANIQVESGTTATSFKAFGQYLSSISGYETYRPYYTFSSTPGGKNLFNKLDVVDGAYVDNVGVYQTGSPTRSSTALINVSGLTNITVSGFTPTPTVGGKGNYHFVNIFGTVLTYGKATTLPATLAVPAGATGFRMSVREGDIDVSYYNTIQIESGSSATTYQAYISVKTLKSIDNIQIPNIATSTALSQWYNKKISVEGDSIMEQGYITSDIAHRTGCNINMLARSGSGFVKTDGYGQNTTIRSRIVNVANQNPDCVFIMGGTNDFGNNVPLGSAAVINDDTQFYSAVYNTFRVLREQNLTVPVLICTPIQRYWNNLSEDRAYVNGLNLKLIDYVNVIKTIANLFSFQVCDTYAFGGITYENRNTYTVDGLHPNALGGILIGGTVTQYLNRLVITS